MVLLACNLLDTVFIITFIILLLHKLLQDTTASLQDVIYAIIIIKSDNKERVTGTINN